MGPPERSSVEAGGRGRHPHQAVGHLLLLRGPRLRLPQVERGGGKRGVGAARLGLEGEPGSAEELLHRLLRPLPRRQALLDVEDGVPVREVLDGEGERGDEGLENPLSPDGHRRYGHGPPGVQAPVEGLGLQDLGQVPLVVLEDEGHLRRVEVVGEEVLGHLPVALEVLLPPVQRGVDDEDEGVGALEDQAPRRGVHRLAGDREDLETQVEAPEAGGLQGQQVEQDRAVLGGVDRDHLAPAPTVGALVENLEIGGLPAQRRAVVDHLDLDRAVPMVELDHVSLPPGEGVEAVYRSRPALSRTATGAARPAPAARRHDPGREGCPRGWGPRHSARRAPRDEGFFRAEGVA